MPKKGGLPARVKIESGDCPAEQQSKNARTGPLVYYTFLAVPKRVSFYVEAKAGERICPLMRAFEQERAAVSARLAARARPAPMCMSVSCKTRCTRARHQAMEKEVPIRLVCATV